MRVAKRDPDVTGQSEIINEIQNQSPLVASPANVYAYPCPFALDTVSITGTLVEWLTRGRRHAWKGREEKPGAMGRLVEAWSGAIIGSEEGAISTWHLGVEGEAGGASWERVE